MGSSRLPGKVLRPIGDKPLLAHVLGRLALSELELTAVVATSDQSQDDAIAAFCASYPVECFRGNESDVLDRYYRCAKQYGFENTIRLTADNPFTDIEEMDRLVRRHTDDKNAFTYSFTQLPIGLGAEVFSFDALEQSWRHGHEPHHREHVDEYLIEHPEIFRTAELQVPPEKNKPELRLTVDTEHDWQLANDLVLKSGGTWLTTVNLIELCSASV